MIKRILVVMMVMVSLVGCSTLHYKTPTGNPEGYDKKIVIDKSKSEVWDALLIGLSDKFFAVNNIEKDSGFVNVSFYSNNACAYVNCGYYEKWENDSKNIMNVCDCDPKMKFYSGMWRFDTCSTTIEGRINILVQELGNDKSSLSVNIRNIVIHRANLWNTWDGRYRYINDTVVFDSKQVGHGQSISCYSTGSLEDEILGIIQSIIK